MLMNEVLIYLLVCAFICVFVFIGIFDIVYYNYCTRRDYLEIGLQAEDTKYKNLEELEQRDIGYQSYVIRKYAK